MMMMMMMMMVMIIIIPHVVVLGRALAPIVLLVVGFQLLIHVNGQPLKAKPSINSTVKLVTIVLMMIIPILVTLVGIVTDASDVH